MEIREDLIIEESGAPGAGASGVANPDPGKNVGGNAAQSPEDPANPPTEPSGGDAVGGQSTGNDGTITLFPTGAQDGAGDNNQDNTGDDTGDDTGADTGANTGGNNQDNTWDDTQDNAEDSTGTLVTTVGTSAEAPVVTEEPGKEGGGFNIWIIVIIAVIVLLAAAIALVVVKLVKNSKKKKRAQQMRDAETMYAPPPAQKPSTRVPVRRKGQRPSMADNSGPPSTPVRSAPGSVVTGTASGGFKIGFAQTIGARENQEDSYCITDWTNPAVVAERGLLAAVADGIGGLSNGQVASGAVVRNLCGRFERQDPARPMSDRLLELAAQAQQDVLQINMRGERCGTTLVSVLIKNKEMALLSVGDSRIVLYRAGALMQLNREHTLGRENDEKQALSMDGETLDKRKQGALTSYLGKEKLRSIDRNLKPVNLVPGDRILLMSDGVFGTLKDQEIIDKLSLEPEQAAKAIIRAVDDQKRPGQDNATIVIVGIE